MSALGDIALDAPAGRVSDANQTLLVRADASAKTPEAISAIEINPNTRVSDVADVVFGPAERTTSLRMNGKTGIGLGILRQAKSNTLDISAGVSAAVDELQPSLPEGVSLIITSDNATFISYSIEEVLFTLFLATSIVIAIIYVFLRSARVTFIPAVTVPIALIGTLAAIWLAGFSINILTLLALVLATGLVVDDAIVVVENISRQRALGLGPRARRRDRHAAGLLRRDLDDGDARRGVRADLVLSRHRRPAVLRIRVRPRLRGRPVRLRRAHPCRRCSRRAGSATATRRRAAIRSAAG